MNRALLWLIGGVVVLALAILAIAPELLADLGTAGSAVGIALAALVPAAIVAVLFVSTRRRRRGRDLGPPHDDGAPHDAGPSHHARPPHDAGAPHDADPPHRDRSDRSDQGG